MQHARREGAYGAIQAENFIRDGLERFSRRTSEILRLADGRFISVVRRPMPDGGLLSTHEDITEREQLSARIDQQNELLIEREQELNVRNEQLDAALNNMVQGLAMFDAKFRLVICNKRYAEMYGLTPEQVKPGTPLREIIEHRIAKGEFRGKSADELVEERVKRVAGQATAQYVNELSDGRYIAVSHPADAGRRHGHDAPGHHRAAPLRGQDRAHGAARRADRPAQPRAAQRAARAGAAARQARRDAWPCTCSTSTTSRTSTTRSAIRSATSCCRMVADRLRALVRETDTIARMGGDEFAIVQVAHRAAGGRHRAGAARHRGASAQPYEIDGHQVVIGTSIGIAVGPVGRR